MENKNIDIGEFRKQHGLTQFEAAKLIGVSPETIRRWEAGVVSPNEENKEKLLEAIEIYENK